MVPSDKNEKIESENLEEFWNQKRNRILALGKMREEKGMVAEAHLKDPKDRF